MTEKFFSIVAELADGSSSLLGVQSESSSAAFRQVRDRADVRRVGRVTEVTEAEFGRIARGGMPAPSAPPKQDAAPAPRPEGPVVDRPATPAWTSHVISGPRTVVYAPPASGEQPFKHLKAPPERPKPPAPAPQPQRVAQQPARIAASTLAEPQAASDAEPLSMPTATGDTEYRIHKSRRRDGLPFLLQRGQWQQVKGKRAFEVQWEKGFEAREQAERHLDWVQQTERELAEFQQSA
jgi:hypothetical protein